LTGSGPSLYAPGEAKDGIVRVVQVGGGTLVSTTIELRRLDRVSAAAVAIAAISANDTYRSATVGEGVYQFSRVYRPRWATISGWALTIGLLGAGYWLLLIKRTEACTMWVTEDRATVRVVLAGILLPDVYERLCNAFEEVEGTAGPSSEVNDSENARFDGDDLLASRVFRSSPTLSTTVIDLTADDPDVTDEIDLRAPVAAPAPSAVLDLPEVRFAGGEQIRVMGLVYVGRDPMHHDANGRAIEWLAVEDPTGTVAKTHFAMGANLGGLWVEDLFSSTGTSVGVDAQTARRVRPLERMAVRPGETIFFGDLSALVLADGDRASASGARFDPSSRV
jgi:hypothetical protein